jgi:hypothetical protein
MAITRIKIEREREGQSMAMLGIFKASWLKILYAEFHRDEANDFVFKTRGTKQDRFIII